MALLVLGNLRLLRVFCKAGRSNEDMFVGLGFYESLVLAPSAGVPGGLWEQLVGDGYGYFGSEVSIYGVAWPHTSLEV